MLPFEFIVEGSPVSQQTRRRTRTLPPWKAAVRAGAQRYWEAGASPLEETICVEITHFYAGAPADVDNIIKPILDAIKGVVYLDDRQISDVVSRRRPLEGPYSLADVGPILAEGISLGREF